MSALIEMKRVTKLYGNVIGLNDVSISLDEGVYGLLGPNGSGKTTFINLIMGQLRPSIGQMRVFGSNPNWAGGYLGEIGLCPATDIYVPQMTGLQWVTHQVALYGHSLPRAKQLAIKALEQVKMAHAWDRLISTYSLGMRQRCKLAQAIAHDPRLLILDEPFNGLDPVGRFEMTDFLNRWIGKGRSLIMASHILHEVEAVDCQFLLLSGGRLLASGSPREVRSLLPDVLNQVLIQTPHFREIAATLLTSPTISSLRLDEEKQTILVTTSEVTELTELLGGMVKNQGYVVNELRPEDESLQSLFNILMQVHRGER